MNYWEQRALKSRRATDLIEADGFKRLNSQYNSTLKRIDKDIKAFDEKYANDKLSKFETDKIKKKIKETSNYNKKDLYLKQIYKETAPLYQITRLEGLNLELQNQLTQLTSMQDIQIEKTVVDVGMSSAILTSSAFSQRYKSLQLSGISKATIKTLANTSWLGKKNFSKRIWGSRKELGREVDLILKNGISKGLSLPKIAKEVKDKFSTSNYNAMRLVRTESTHIHNQASLLIYEEAGADKYEYMAYLDNRTSEICSGLDGKIFNTKDAEVGVNYPPMHPNCRSTTIPVLK